MKVEIELFFKAHKDHPPSLSFSKPTGRISAEMK
jgi:hypothetical protein